MPEIAVFVFVAALLVFCWFGIPRLLGSDLAEPIRVWAAPKPPECHPAPKILFTPVQAHREMQRLIDCDIKTCARKNSAYWTMVDAGHARPAIGVQR